MGAAKEERTYLYIIFLFNEIILRELEGLQGFLIVEHNINNLQYADNTVLLAVSEEKLQDLLNKVVVEKQEKRTDS